MPGSLLRSLLSAINPDDGASHPGGKRATRSSPDVKVRGYALPYRMGTIAPGQVQPRQVGSPPQTRVPR